MDLGVAGTAFAIVFVAELPDKTALATLVLATRHHPVAVWAGAASALLVQCPVAVALGGVLSLLPARPVRAVAAPLAGTGVVKAAATSFAVLSVAEWGDFTQVATASLAARYADPVSVLAGAWTALACVAGLAAGLGRALSRIVPLDAVRRAGAVLFALVAVVTAVEVVTA